MIKLIHTADWHLGQTFFGYDRREEHRHFLEWLRQTVVSVQADVLLVAGDVFDSPNPSAESQKLYYRFLREVTQARPSLQIVLIAGNHDSAARLEAPNPLFEDMNITVRGMVRRTPEGTIDYDHLIVPLRKDGQVEACCLAVPYLRQGDYPPSESYAEGVQALYRELIAHAMSKGNKLVVMGHMQATGSEISVDDRSERTVIGGLDSISPQVFDAGVLYVALGHLHRAQKVSGREWVRYAGAPLPMSFAEKNYRQGVNLITLGDGKEADDVCIERLDYEPLVSLCSIPPQPAGIDAVLQAVAALPDGVPDDTAPYLEVKVLVTEPDPSMRHKIEQALEGKRVRLARIVAATPEYKEEARKFVTYEELQAFRPTDMARDVYRRKYGGNDMPESLCRMFDDVIRELKINQ